MFQGHLSEVRLTKEEEEELIIRSHQECQCKGNHTINCDACEARGELIDAHSRWLLKVCIDHCNLFPNLSLKPHELMADAIDGFCKALEGFKNRDSMRLLTFSKKCIIWALINNDLLTGVIVVPAWVRQLRRRALKLLRESDAKGIQISLEDIARETGRSVAAVTTALSPVRCDLGLQTLDSEYNSETGSPTTGFDIGVEDSNNWMYESDAQTLMSTLSEREKKIVSAKIGMVEQPLSGEEIAKQFGVTRATIHKIYKKAIKKMRASIISDLADYGDKC